MKQYYSSNATTPVLVIGELTNESDLSLSTLSAITAASKLSSNIYLFIASKQNPSKSQSFTKLNSVQKIIVVVSDKLEHSIAEFISPLVIEAHKKYNFSHIISAASSFGKNLIPRIAAVLDVSPITEVIDIKSADTFVRPIYAGNAISTVRSKDPVKVLTIRQTAFQKADSGTNPTSAVVEELTPKFDGVPNIVWESGSAKTSERPELTSASIVVSGGRGLKSQQNFAILEKLADKLGAAVGASRAAVDAGYAPNDWQVGQTGKVVAPDLYIAVGISGAIQHLAGMKDSKVIVAINKDPEAPIFQVADYGLVADLFNAVPELTNEIKK